MPEIDVLIVEDDESIIELICMVLEEYDFSAQAAADGEEALAIMRQQRPKLVLLDLALPGMSGWDVVAAMRGNHVLRDIPVVVMSGARDISAQASALGVTAFLLKPFSIDDLVALVTRVTGRKPREAA